MPQTKWLIPSASSLRLFLHLLWEQSKSHFYDNETYIIHSSVLTEDHNNVCFSRRYPGLSLAPKAWASTKTKKHVPASAKAVKNKSVKPQVRTIWQKTLQWQHNVNLNLSIVTYLDTVITARYEIWHSCMAFLHDLPTDQNDEAIKLFIFMASQFVLFLPCCFIMGNVDNGHKFWIQLKFEYNHTRGRDRQVVEIDR